MLKTAIQILSLYELALITAAIVGVTYDFYRSTIRSRTTVPDI